MSDHIIPVTHESELCPICLKQPGTIEDADGEYICIDCYTTRMDRDYERLRDMPTTDNSQGEPNG